jgi:hypothetical protein
MDQFFSSPQVPESNAIKECIQLVLSNIQQVELLSFYLQFKDFEIFLKKLIILQHKEKKVPDLLMNFFMKFQCKKIISSIYFIKCLNWCSYCGKASKSGRISQIVTDVSPIDNLVFWEYFNKVVLWLTQSIQPFIQFVIHLLGEKIWSWNSTNFQKPSLILLEILCRCSTTYSYETSSNYGDCGSCIFLISTWFYWNIKKIITSVSRKCPNEILSNWEEILKIRQFEFYEGIT